MSNKRHSTDAARGVKTEPVGLPDGLLLPLSEVARLLKVRLATVIAWKREGLGEFVFRMEGKTEYVESDDVKEFIRNKYKKRRE